MKDYLQRLRGDLISEGTPYGFTLTIWGTGAIALKIYKVHSIASIFLFVAAPIVVYAIIVLLLDLLFPEESSPPIPAMQSSGISYIDLISVLLAVACAYGLILAIPIPVAGFPAASGVAMLVYNLLLAAQRTLFSKASG